MNIDKSKYDKKVDLPSSKSSDLIDRVRQGDTRVISRLITLAERDDCRATDVLRGLQPYTGKAHIVGITGIPGGGKSTLVNQLTRVVTAEGLKVGVLAVDPSSPFTQGAILGDRLRMQGHKDEDDGTFIRSLSSRGETGGLSSAIWDAALILDASGRDIIFIETVGAGQLDTDIISASHTVVVISVPGIGDSIQTIKAGLMEIGDIFVVNMADKPQISQTVQQLEAQHLESRDNPTWKIPILTTIATNGKGVANL